MFLTSAWLKPGRKLADNHLVYCCLPWELNFGLDWRLRSGTQLRHKRHLILSVPSKDTVPEAFPTVRSKSKWFL